jgi:polycystin 2/polycystin 2L1
MKQSQVDVYHGNRSQEFGDGDFDEDEYGDEAQLQRLKELNREAFKSMMIFFAFLTIFTVVVVSGQSENTSRFADQVRRKIQDGRVPLHTVTTIPTYWTYLEGTLMPAMYPHNEDTKMAGNESTLLHPLDLSNRLMGGIRMRQIRVVQKENCQVGGLFQQYKTLCYPEYQEQLTESQDSFGPKKIYRWGEDTAGSTYTGKLASYSPNGFMQTFTTNRSRTMLEMRNLREQGFLDAATRAVMVDFTIWNSNLGLYAVSRVVHEFAPSGAVSGSVRVLIMSERFFTPGGKETVGEWFAIVGEVAIIIFVVFYLGEEFSECSVMKWEYLKDAWNLMDWLNMFLLLYAFGSRMTVLIDASSSGLTVGENELLDKDSYTNLQAFAEQIEQAGLINAFNAVLLWAKFFKFSGYVPYVKILIEAIGGSFVLFISFLAMFVIAFVGFVISYNVGFGDKINEFATFHGACVYLGRSFLGDIDLLPVYRVSPLFGAVLILLFYVMIMVVFMNVFFAILTNALHESKYGDKDVVDDSAVLTQIWEDAKDWFVKKIELERRLKTSSPNMYKKYKARQAARQAKKATIQTQPSSASIGDMKGGTQYSSSSDMTTSSSGDSYDTLHRPVSSFKAKEVMQSVEHMAGRILSRIQGMGIEIRSEVLDVYEKMAMMDLAVSELTRRAKVIELEQEQMMSE